MKKRIVYKVFSIGKRNRLSSWCAPYGCDQIYKKRKINRPKLPGSLIFVFQTLQHVKDFISTDYSGDYPIYQCEATGVRPLSTRANVTHFRGLVEETWKAGGAFELDAHPGTLGCKTLKLIKKM